MNNTRRKSEFRKKLHEAAKIAHSAVANDKTMELMNKKGEKVEKKFISFEEYVDDLFKRKRILALAAVKDVPRMREDLGNGILQSIYEEIRESFTLTMFPSAIMHSILLLEYAMRIRLYKERQKSDPNTKWETVAEMKIRQLTAPLQKAKVITQDEKKDLDDFNDKIRNPYMHINVYELTKGMTLDVTSANIVKEEIKRIREMPVTDNQFLWYWGKKKYDASNVLSIMKKCIDYVNKISH